jgi:sugar phosphate isomerase/epimerase
MTTMNRRDFTKLAAVGTLSAVPDHAALARAKKTIDSRVRGVLLGIQTYSLRDRSIDAAIDAMAKVRIGSCELWQGSLEPMEIIRRTWSGDAAAREELRQWRLKTPLSFFHAVREKFDRAGVALQAYNYSMTDDFTDEEIARGFEMAKALGAGFMTSSSNVTTPKRFDSVAERYKMKVGLHNHAEVDRPNEISTAETILRAIEGRSPFVAINFDIGHFTAANGDAVAFLGEHHERIVALHVKDRKRDRGPNVPFGEGDAPIGEVLRMLRDKRWPIPANLEYEYDGKETVAEIARCRDYCKAALEG